MISWNMKDKRKRVKQKIWGNVSHHS